MSNFNRAERLIAKLLSGFPRLKKVFKFIYSRLSYLRNKRDYRVRTELTLQAVSGEKNLDESFFGYYDKSPANSLGFTLAHFSDEDTKNVPKKGSVRISVLDRAGNIIHTVHTSAFNWQQGSRAHWLSDDTFIYNDFDERVAKYISKVISLKEGREISRYDYPVQDSFNDSYFLSINYQRLLTLRPDYGYRNLPILTPSSLNDLKNDGIWRIDFKTGCEKLIVTIEDACNIGTIGDFRKAVHKINHVMISPSGEKFIFMHRYIVGGRRFDRLILAGSNFGELKLLSDYGMVSHCFWIDDNSVLGYMRGPENIDGYWIIDVNKGTFSPCLQSELAKYGDGHPHVYGDWFVTDSYPNKARMQHLLLCNWRTSEVKELGEFFHSFDFQGQSRCDLHPRFSPDGRAVFFDSVFSGKRQLYRMELPH